MASLNTGISVSKEILQTAKMIAWQHWMMKNTADVSRDPDHLWENIESEHCAYIAAALAARHCVFDEVADHLEQKGKVMNEKALSAAAVSIRNFA